MNREDALERVVEAFSAIKFGEEFTAGMNGFVDECYDASFSLVDIPFIELQDQLSGCDTKTMMEICEKLWELLRLTDPASVQESGTPKETNLLTALEQEKIPLRELFAAIAVFIHAALKTKSNNATATAGCLAAAIYFCMLTATKGRIPANLHGPLGSAKLFNQSLYSRALDILNQPNNWEGHQPAVKKKPRKNQKKNAQIGEEYDEIELVTEANGVVWEVAQQAFLKSLVYFIRNLDHKQDIPYHFGRIIRNLHNIWRRDYADKEITFDRFSVDVDPFKMQASYFISRCFGLLLAPWQKTLPLNLSALLWGVEPGVLRLTDQMTSYQVPPNIVKIFSRHTTNLCLEAIRQLIDNEDCAVVIVDFLMDLFCNVPDVADYRRVASATFLLFLQNVPPAMRNKVIQMVAMEADADKVKSRCFALEVAGALWSTPFDDVNVPYLNCNSRKAVVLDICCRRMLDKSSKIRGTAGAILAEIVESDPNAFVNLPERNEGAAGGEWTLRQVVNTILGNCSEISAISRKNYLKLLGKIVLSDFTFLDANVKDVLLRAAQDYTKGVRETNMTIINSFIILPIEQVADLWIRCVFRLYMDSEQSVRSKSMDLFEQTVLNAIVNQDVNQDQLKFAWKLLDRICEDDLGDLRLLRQLLFDLEKNKTPDQKPDTRGPRITKVHFARLLEFTKGEHKVTAWMLLAELAPLIKGTNTTFALTALEDGTIESDDVTAACIFKILRARFTAGKTFHQEELDRLVSSFSRINGVASVVEAIRAIAAAHELGGTHEFDEWAEDILYSTAKKLQALLLSLNGSQNRTRNRTRLSVESENDHVEEKVIFCIRVMGELGCYWKHWKKRYSEKDNAGGSKKAIWKVKDIDAVELISRTCDFDSSYKYSPAVRAHGVFSLGRWCLSDKRLTWIFSEPIISLAHRNETDVGLRRDAVVVVFDLLKMFGDVIESKLGKVYGWLADPCASIRGDVINHLHDLLLNEHLQWDSAVFYQFLMSISDPNPTIREWVRSSLRCLMKKRNQCYTDFVESIVFLNGCVDHPRFKAAKQADSQGVDFKLARADCTDKRMEIYSFMLNQMNDEQKRHTYARMLEQIFMPVVSGEVTLDDRGFSFQSVVSDAVRVLGLKELEFSVLGKNTEDDDEGEDCGEENQDPEQIEDEARRQLEKELKAARKQLWEKFRNEVIQRSLLPVLGSIFRKARDCSSPKLKNLVIQLVDNLTTSAGINIAELAESTAGAEGRILQAMAMEIRQLRERERANQVGTPALEDDSQDDSLKDMGEIPGIHQSPNIDTNDLLSLPKSTPGQVAVDSITINTAPRSAEDAASVKTTAKKPPSWKKTNKDHDEAEMPTVAKKSSGMLKNDIDISEDQSPGTEDESVRRPTRSRAATQVKMAPPSGTIKSVRQKRIISPASSSLSGNVLTTRKAKEKSVSGERTSTSVSHLQKERSEPVGEDSCEADDTLQPMRESPKKKAPKFNDTISAGPSRAISTPVANRTKRTLDLTFGSDLSIIENPSLSQPPSRNLRRATQAVKK